MIEICPQEQCTGCSACYAACSNKAITMSKDKFGFEHPQIDSNVCLNCGLCVKVCPNNTRTTREHSIRSYVCHAKNPQEQLTSTSGGLASVISRYVIQNGGVVYGCSAQPNLKVQHIRIEDEKDVELLKGSKYVQSHIGLIFKEVKADLIKKRLVLFIGTPCQVAGLKSFLKKDFENLLAVDFVCHGVPSIQMLKDSIGNIDTSKTKLIFRYKYVKRGSTSYKSEYGVYLLSKNNDINYKRVYPKGLYILGFINALFYRNSCYKCRYATPDRVSDFTLGDFHDNENNYVSLSGHERILSMAMINTHKAAELWKKLIPYVEYSSCPLEIMINKHDQLHKPMDMHRNYKMFRDLYLVNGFNYAAKKALSKEILAYKIKYLKNILVSIPIVNIFIRKEIWIRKKSL